MRQLTIEKGDKFGKLTVIREVAKIGHYRAFKLKCECGNTTTVKLNALRKKKRPTLSCGCLHIASLGNRRTHGMSKTLTYTTWLAMKNRCENLSHKAYVNYGGRGIRVCKRWQKFENFLEDMGERPNDQSEISRINNDGNYQLDNCEWTDDGTAQIRNRRKQKDTSSRFRGVDYWVSNNSVTEGWRARITIDGKLHHIGLFDREKKAARAYDEVARLHKGYILNFPK
jgi:hypothetical protein